MTLVNRSSHLQPKRARLPDGSVPLLFAAAGAVLLKQIKSKVIRSLALVRILEWKAACKHLTVIGTSVIRIAHSNRRAGAGSNGDADCNSFRQQA